MAYPEWQTERVVAVRIFGARVRAEPTALLPALAAWGVVTAVGSHLHPERGLGKSLLIGLTTTGVLLPAELGHAFAHVLSARYAGAPMDEVRISASMPRTLYWNNDVSPNAHRLRALGGPIFNALGLLVSLTIHRLAPRESIARELAAWSALGHGWLVVTSLTPVPVVDGGSLLKWTLVARGRSEPQADVMVRRVDLGLGILGVILGLWFVARRLPRRTGR